MFLKLEIIFRNVTFFAGGFLAMLLFLNGFGLQTFLIQSIPNEPMVYYTTGLGEGYIWGTTTAFFAWIVLRVLRAQNN
jgi:hypothetical protein